MKAGVAHNENAMRGIYLYLKDVNYFYLSGLPCKEKHLRIFMHFLKQFQWIISKVLWALFWLFGVHD